MAHARALAHLKQADPKLAALIAAQGACTLKPNYADPFAALCEAILYQQLTGKAAATIIGRFKGLYGGKHPSPKRALGTPIEDLRGVGLSNAKARAVLDLAQKVHDGTLDFDALHDLDDAQVIKQLVQVRGVGPWTAEMFLIFNLGRPDVFPLGDYGIQKGVQQLYGYKKLPAARTMLRHAKPWQPYRSVATWYLWRLVDG